MLLPYLTMATPVSEVESMLHVQFVSSFTPSWRYAQDSAVPVLTSQSDNHVLQLAWGLRLKKKKATPSLWVQAEGIIKQRATRVSIRIRRCLAIANCFFIKSFPSDILIYNPREKFMLLAGIWESWKDEDHSTRSAFALVTRKAPERLSKLTDRVPVIIHPAGMRKFLNSSLPLMDISGMLNGSRYPEVNGYDLESSVFEKTVWERKDILPSGNKIFREQHPDIGKIFHSRYF